jgi:hypothetical protein
MLGNATRAALKAYYPKFPVDKAYSDFTEKERKQYDVATKIGLANLRRHPNPTRLFMEQQGMDFKKLTDKLKEGLDATQTTNAFIITKSGKNGKAKQGSIEIPDYAERREWWDRFARILGVSVKEFPQQGGGQKTQVNVFRDAVEKSSEFIEGEEA